MGNLSAIWHDPVWSKVIAAIIFFFLTPFLNRINNRQKSFWNSFKELWTLKAPVWVYLLSLLLIYIGTHLSDYDYYVYLIVIFLVLIYNRIFSHPSQIDQESFTKEITENFPIAPPIHRIWFDSDEANTQCLSVIMERRWENDAAVGETAQGTLSYLENKMIDIKRKNTDGRVIVKLDRLRPYNFNDRIFQSDTSRGPTRKISVVFYAKIIEGSHLIWFMAKHAGQYQWVHNANARVEISNDIWRKFSLSFTVPSTIDFELYFEDRDVKKAPSSIQIKELKVIEY